KNNKIYSGLGLLLSPSSSTGNDLEDIGGSSIKSPGCVLRDMTSRFVPDDRLVSPLNERVKQIEVKEGKKSCAVVSDTQQTQVPPIEAASHEYWVACDQCNAWRLLSIGITAANLPKNWWCSRSTWLPGKNYCDVSKDETTQAICEMNFKISSQYHVIGDTYHANSNANSETLPNGWKKNKSRPDGCNSRNFTFINGW
nr:CW-type zinc finger [Tanacetum cinerariifolium]